MSLHIGKLGFTFCTSMEDNMTYIAVRDGMSLCVSAYAPVICNYGAYGARDSGGLVGLKYHTFT